MFSGWLSSRVAGAGMIRSRGLRRDEVRIKRDRHFMRAVTHELKTPLSTIQLGVDTLKRVSLSEEDTGRVIEGMQRGVEALNHRVEDILVASKLNRDAPLVLTSFHWSDVVHEALCLDNHPGGTSESSKNPKGSGLGRIGPAHACLGQPAGQRTSSHGRCGGGSLGPRRALSVVQGVG